MHETDFWTRSSAEALELSIEGNRLIANAVAQVVQSLWKRTVLAVDTALHAPEEHHHLPPV